MFHIEGVVDEIARERLQEFLIGRRIGGPDIIHRLDQTASHEVLPDAIDGDAGKKGIFTRSQPAGQDIAPVFVRIQGNRGRIQRLRRHRDQKPWMQDVTRFTGKNRDISSGTVLLRHTRKEVRKSVIVFLGPLLERVIVAAGARQTHPQEGLGRILGQIYWILLDQEVAGRPVLGRVARSREDLTDESVPGFRLLYAVTDELIVGAHAPGRQFATRDQQDIGPLVGPVVDVLGPSQQRVDQLRPLAGTGVV